DLMIDGAGYFQVQMPNGDAAYTRAGNFKLSPEGTLVTSDGYPVQPAITIPAGATDIAINASGEVQVKLDGQTNPQTVGQFQLAGFPNSGCL
ncbi:MAG: flagellar basal body rod protein FlgG, partial [Gammaproteobacteria bacterium]